MTRSAIPRYSDLTQAQYTASRTNRNNGNWELHFCVHFIMCTAILWSNPVLAWTTSLFVFLNCEVLNHAYLYFYLQMSLTVIVIVLFWVGLQARPYIVIKCVSGLGLCVLELADHAQIAKRWMERMDDRICVCSNRLHRKVMHRPPIKWQHMIQWI